MTAGVLGTLGHVSLSAATMILAAMVLRFRFQERVPRRVFCLLWDLCPCGSPRRSPSGPCCL